MVDWKSQHVIELTSFVFDQMLVYLLGLYGWHFITTFKYVEWRLLTRKFRFRSGYLPYLFGRYALLAVLITLTVVTRDTSSRINCAAGMRALSALGNIASACASTNLLVRAWILWKHNRIIKTMLLLLSVAQWLIALTIGLANIQPSRDSYVFCGQVNTNNHHELIVFFFYTVCYDTVILILTVAGLGPRSPSGKGRRLWEMIFRQGLWYLITTLFVNVPVVVFAWIELNAVMDIFYSVPATTISVIVSSAAFIELIELKICDISEADTSQDPQHIRSSGKGVEVLTSHVDISPSLFINSDELPEGITRNSFDEESGMRTAREGVIGVGEGPSGN